MALTDKAISNAITEDWAMAEAEAVNLKTDEALATTVTLPSYRKDQLSLAAKSDKFHRDGLEDLSNPSFYRNNRTLAAAGKSTIWPAWENDIVAECAICTEQLGGIWRFPASILSDAERAINGDKVARGRVRDYRNPNVAFALIRHHGSELRFCSGCLGNTDHVVGFRAWLQTHDEAWRGTFASDHLDWLGVLNAVARMAELGFSIPGSFDNRPVGSEYQDVVWPLTREARLRGIRNNRNERIITAAKDAAKQDKS